MNNYSYHEIIKLAINMHDMYSSNPSCSGCPCKQYSTNVSLDARECLGKLAFQSPEKFAKIVMDWGLEHPMLDGIEFSPTQERQIDIVLDSAKALVETMITKPQYLNGTLLKGYSEDHDYFPVHPAEVADMILLKNPRDFNVFFPVHIEDTRDNGDDVECVRDTYNEPFYDK